MIPYFWYMLKVIICSGILFGYYWIFLRNKIFHQYNRFYLLAAMVLSLLLPLLKINFWQEGAQTNQAINVLRAVSAGDEYVNNVVIGSGNSYWNLQNLYPLIYWSVSLLFLMIMLRTLLLIYKLLNRYPVQQVEEVSFVNTSDDSTPFSFFKYIFWNSNIDIATTTGRQIFKHEVAHIQEKHTYDKLFINITLIFCWCNPFFWLYRKELHMIHEFIADKKAVEDSDTAAFAAMILQATYPKHRFELANNFFYSPIKRRLRMLTKIDNPKVSYMARVMVLPLALLVFAAFTFKTKSNSSTYHGKKITVIIDAGHGGYDAGVRSTDGVYEKDLTLALAKKVKELNTNGSIDILLTREEDIYQSPQQKALIAENKNADILISLHIGGTERPNTKTGIEFFVARDQFENAGKSKELASLLIRAFENNFPLPVSGSPQQREKGIWILQANDIPSVLIEAGYITNEKDFSYLKTDAAKETIAKNVLEAIEKFVTTNSIASESNIDVNMPETNSLRLQDTLPDSDKADTEKALLIVNGKIVGKGKKIFEQQSGILISGQSINVKWLGKSAANTKYGKPGADGACEITFSEEATFTNANGEKADKIILEKKLQELELVELKQKVLLDQNGKLQQAYLEKLAQLKRDDSLTDKSILVSKLKQQELQKAKLDMLMLQQEKLKLDYNEKLALAKVQDDNFEKTVEGKKLREEELVALKQKLSLIEEENKSNLALAEKTVDGKKLSDQELANLKQKLILEQQVKNKQQYEEKLTQLNDRNIEKEKELYQLQKQLAGDENMVFVKAEQGPQFTGGQDAWRKYLMANLKSTIPVEEGWKAGKYTVIVKFIVHTDGTVSDVTAENYNGSKTAQHCIDVIKNAPKWQPAVQNGKKVNAYHKQPITFVIADK